MNGSIMCIIKYVSTRRNLYSPVKFAAHFYVFFNYLETSRMIGTFVRSFALSIRSEPSIAAFLFLSHHRFPIKNIYTKNTIAILRRQRKVQQLGCVSICPTVTMNSLVRICKTPSSRLIQIRNTNLSAFKIFGKRIVSFAFV